MYFSRINGINLLEASEDTKRLGEYLKKTAGKKHMSVKKVAMEARLTEDMVNRLYAGTILLSYQRFNRVCHVLGVPVETALDILNH